ncbi:MAG: phosphoenolpyruvate carboxykinase (ATP) [Zetaproteobacteria bacterium CG12_big_fil_rev_8_21_14_0_65_55_1124]|nr:MAG: phosphoenolpyruvate carboxykinase (ATP) [Zetaproteobacteria bacterium CG1_02_55_237]PIS19080.1 MAG: phosphoenolpyruvate carboxykinase (ATP) [Zetaproteobacteria bacterium CG08_land_8_20_14_0_20_55_17]PIW41947.1 MAG: phosphoenolpyruvate carboxykinase (ATP) [Zetaproteobacteria bacterium CG12_big_fil_rev_8_21_14_0_65_55_1124]PIY51409.1 MAG: phosphoenolpyruvate carboxykinase (ATP) [Zetaproteobacteria bacterium CG_4_10_14_0_8_um_filter_55_43]PIZ36996.1 MAG: phosphoenolpyruvate carboxykinase (
MTITATEHIRDALIGLGLSNLEYIFWDLPTPRLYEHAIRNREGHLAHMGALVVRTGHFTGRAVKDKFVVDEPASHDHIWWGTFNRPLPEEKFDAIYKRVCRFLEGQQVYVEDCLVGADSQYEKAVRVITQDAWHALFARTMFVRPVDLGRDIAKDKPAFTVIHVPHFHAMPSQDGTNSEAFVLLHMSKRIALIGGTSYAGEIKKSIFTIMNYLLPEEDVLPMHSSANVGKNDDVAVFFGLSGTGKTTLSSDPARKLIGDDEHGWSDHDVFNFEGGCYAKVAKLSKQKEPMIYDATQRFGSILENVGFNTVTRRVDFDDISLTENTRAAYPIQAIPNAIYPGVAAQPNNIVMLTADAFGVLPPIAKLTAEQAMRYFMLGYTAKVAGTEAGLKEPEATFSPCFGAPFMARHPKVYADMLGKKIREQKVNCWLINTGWSGGPYGVGERMDIDATRAMLNAALDGNLDKVPYTTDEFFGLSVPQSCPGVDAAMLNPASTWADNAAYAESASKLAARFDERYAQMLSEASA